MIPPILSSFLPSPRTPIRFRKNREQQPDLRSSFLHGFSSSSPSLRNRYSTSSDRVMGQAHPKATAVDLEVSPSTGPDPTIFRPQHATHSSLPPMPEPPHSAPMLPQSTDQTFSRIDYTPGPAHRPIKSLTSKPKFLARKMSQKGKGSHGPGKSVGEGMKAFQGMVQAAEARVGIDQGSGKTVKASTYNKAKRSSISEGCLEPPRSAPLPTNTVPFPEFTPPPPAQIARPTHHRRSSSNSVKSGRVSIKSSKRAEREWRARVAAMAYATSPHSSFVELRGPVPPKRTPGPAQCKQRTDSPASDALVTPPHAAPLPAGITSPAMTFMSNRSFETLGHYAHLSPPKQPIDSPDLSIRDRKASVPHSVVSTFYFDPISGSRVSTRPPSFAASQLLATIPSDDTSPLRASCMAPDEDDATTPTDARTRKESLPPFESFQVSPITVSTPLVPCSPALPESTIVPRTYREKRSSAPPSQVKSVPLLPQPGIELQVSIRKDGEGSYNTVPVRNQKIGTPSRSNTVPRNTRMRLEDLPDRSTPSRAKKASTPATPLSPTTAYLLSAPIESITMGGLTCTDSPDRFNAHPFSTVPVTFDSPEPPTPPAKPLMIPLNFSSSSRPSQSSNRPGSPASYDPFTAPPKQAKAKPVRAKEDKAREIERPTVLQPRKSQPRNMVLGPDPARVELERQRIKLRKMGIDLTPGMADGNRPPKSGLPRDDLHRWLVQSSAGSS